MGETYSRHRATHRALCFRQALAGAHCPLERELVLTSQHSRAQLPLGPGPQPGQQMERLS